MRFKLLIPMIFILMIYSVSAFDYLLYDDFESGSINTSKWAVTGGSASINSTIKYEGNYSAFLPLAGTTTLTSLLMNNSLATSGKYIISYWIYDATSPPYSDTFQQNMYNGATTCIWLNAGYPSANVWGYYVGGSWITTNISSVSGVGAVNNTWMNLRILADNDNGKASVRFGNSTTDHLTNITMACTDLTKVQIQSYNANSYNDYFRVWNYSTYGWIYSSASATTASPSFVSPTPANNTHNNSQITINMSCSNANLYTLWFNGSKVLDNVSTSFYTTNVTTSGSYPYFGACYNGSASGFSANSSVYTWVYDVVYPSITFNANNAFNSLNVSQVDQYNNTLPMNITFTDNILLYAYEINITKSGILFYNETNQSLTGTSYTYTKTLNVSSWADGVYNIDVRVSDSHTAKEIKDYDVVKTSKKLDFDTAEGNKVTIESEDDAVTNAEKDFDRYSFEFDFSQKNKKNRVYHVKSDHVIVYLKNSPYAGHFIVFNEKFGGNWIDFEGTGETPEVVKISDYDYKVIFRNSPDKVKFHSIGGLNIYQASVSWYKGSKTLAAGIAGTNNPSNLSLNLTRDSVSQSNFSAYLIYNGTILSNVSRSLGSSMMSFSQNVTTPSSESVVSYYWIGNITQSDGSVLNFNYSGTQNVYNWYLDNCSNSSVKALNLFIYNEESPLTALIADAEVEIKSWIDSESNYHTNFLKLSGQNNYSICLYPNLTLTIDMYVKYNSSGNLTHRFYLQNTEVNNVTQNYSLYNVLDPLPFSSLQLTLRKTQDFSFYPEILAKLQRYYISEGVWRTIQMDQSGNYGLISFDIKEGITDYRLLFYDSDNNLLKTTDKMKFLCSSKVCSITQMLDPQAAAVVSDNLSISVSLDNSTKILNILWSDPQANNNNVEIRVSKQTYTGDLNICDSLQTGAAGSFNCNLTGYTDQVLVSILTSHSPYKPIFSEWISLAKTGFSSLIGKTEGMTWTAGIMMVTIGAGVGFGAIGALVGGILGLIINMFLGFASFLTITFIIVAMAIAIAIGIKIRQ